MNFIQINRRIEEADEKRRHLEYYYSPFTRQMKGRKKHRFMKDIINDYACDIKVEGATPNNGITQDPPTNECKSIQHSVRASIDKKAIKNIASNFVSDRINKINKTQSNFWKLSRNIKEPRIRNVSATFYVPKPKCNINLCKPNSKREAKPASQTRADFYQSSHNSYSATPIIPSPRKLLGENLKNGIYAYYNAISFRDTAITITLNSVEGSLFHILFTLYTDKYEEAYVVLTNGKSEENGQIKINGKPNVLLSHLYPFIKHQYILIKIDVLNKSTIELTKYITFLNFSNENYLKSLLMINKIEIETAKLYNISKSIHSTLTNLCTINYLRLQYNVDNSICYEMVISNSLKAELNRIQRISYVRMLTEYDFQKMVIPKLKIMYIEGEVTCFSFAKYHSMSESIKEISNAESNLIKLESGTKEYFLIKYPKYYYYTRGDTSNDYQNNAVPPASSTSCAERILPCIQGTSLLSKKHHYQLPKMKFIKPKINERRLCDANELTIEGIPLKQTE